MNKRKGLNMEQKRNLTGWAFLLPASILIFVFCFYPMVQALILSFQKGTGSAVQPAGFANYARILKDATFQQCLFNTIFYFVVQVPIMLILALILAQLLNSPDIKGKGIWYQDYGCPLDSPTHVYRGYVSSAVLLYDAAYVTVQDLEITNHSGAILGESYSQPDKMERTGVAVVAKDKGTCRGITLRDLAIHDVNGNVYDKHMNNGGIYMTALSPADEAATGPARFADVLVEGCYLYRVSRWGLAVGYTYAHAHFQGAALEKAPFLKYGHENVTIRDNYVKLAGGDGITVMYALRPLVEHNTADSVACEINDRVYSHPGDRAGKVAAGIWPWKCKDALFRCNEAADTRLNQDSMAYDADSGDGTAYEYNFSRQNEGGCVMFCLQEAIHNTFRHNVSFDDLGGTISPSENPDALITDNVFYVRDGVPFVRPQMGGGNYTAENNTFLPLDKFTP